MKRTNAGRKAQISEWVAGSLARHLGLPVPPFDIAEVPRQLLDLRPTEERREWGDGLVFASRVVDNAVEIRFSDLRKIPLRNQAEILLFDSWIGNGDRMLSDLGGNPNMLWSDLAQQVSIIDHNLAFETPAVDVRAHHVFSAASSAWDLVFFSELPQHLAAAAATVAHIWSKLPDIWVDESAGLITLEGVQERLHMSTDIHSSFWNA